MTNVIKSFGSLCYPTNSPAKTISRFVRDNLDMEHSKMLHVIKRGGEIRTIQTLRLNEVSRRIMELNKLIGRDGGLNPELTR